MVEIFSKRIDTTSSSTIQAGSNELSRTVNAFIKTPNVKVVDTDFQTVYDGTDLIFIVLVNYESSPR